ncbi:DDE-type integrase/transposase/recombinase [Salmonella enterica]|nr:DDE-type integrase/transposase/recombinase [Salmonella enterica]EDQ6556961.1 DDE-type integrase/transposase/recombinase [Salmonella enterica subsp. enterica]EED3334881.1 DDE-type integrase/transposase/recombinase [Salmonella enterica subsp. enterica]
MSILLLRDITGPPKREHKGKITATENNIRWCTDGSEFGYNNGEKLRLTLALDYSNRETINRSMVTEVYDGSTVEDVILRSVEKRFRNRLLGKPMLGLMDDSSAYTAHEMWKFVKELNLKP